MMYNEQIENKLSVVLRLIIRGGQKVQFLTSLGICLLVCILDIFYPLVTETSLRRALILMGPRRVGKTVMMYHSIQRLIDSGVSPQNIIYISVETPIYNNIYLEQLLNLACQILGKTTNSGQLFVFSMRFST